MLQNGLEKVGFIALERIAEGQLVEPKNSRSVQYPAAKLADGFDDYAGRTRENRLTGQLAASALSRLFRLDACGLVRLARL